MEKITFGYDILQKADCWGDDERARGFSDVMEEELANVLDSNHEYERCKELRGKLLDKYIKNYGRNSFGTLSAEQNYYSTLIFIDSDRDEAIKKLKELWKKRKKIKLRDKVAIADNEKYTIYLYEKLAQAYLLRGNDDRAIEYAKMATDECLIKYGIDNFLTVQILNGFSSILIQLREYSSALLVLETIYTKWEKILPKESQFLMTLKYSLGVAYGESGNPAKGMELLSENYSCACDYYGWLDKRTIRYKKEYAICIAKNGEHDKAIGLLNDCKSMYEKVYGLDKSEQLRNIIYSLCLEYSIVHDKKSREAEKKHFIEAGYPAALVEFRN